MAKSKSMLHRKISFRKNPAIVFTVHFMKFCRQRQNFSFCTQGRLLGWNSRPGTVLLRNTFSCWRCFWECAVAQTLSFPLRCAAMHKRMGKGGGGSLIAGRRYALAYGKWGVRLLDCGAPLCTSIWEMRCGSLIAGRRYAQAYGKWGVRGAGPPVLWILSPPFS